MVATWIACMPRFASENDRFHCNALTGLCLPEQLVAKCGAAAQADQH